MKPLSEGVALVVQPVPEFANYLTPEARAVYEKPNGTGVLLQRCKCGVFDARREHVPPITEEMGLVEAREIRERHEGDGVVAAVITMNTVFSVSRLATMADRHSLVRADRLAGAYLKAAKNEELEKPKTAFEVQYERTMKKLADAYNKAVELKLIEHGGLCRASIVELTTVDLSERWVMFLMPYVKLPDSETAAKETWKEQLKRLNDLVLPAGYRQPVFKSEGEV